MIIVGGMILQQRGSADSSLGEDSARGLTADDVGLSMEMVKNYQKLNKHADYIDSGHPKV